MAGGHYSLCLQVFDGAVRGLAVGESTVIEVSVDKDSTAEAGDVLMLITPAKFRLLAQ